MTLRLCSKLFEWFFEEVARTRGRSHTIIAAAMKMDEMGLARVVEVFYCIDFEVRGVFAGKRLALLL
jgi:hypothetical protein